MLRIRRVGTRRFFGGYFIIDELTIISKEEFDAKTVEKKSRKEAK